MGKNLQDFVDGRNELHWERSRQGDAEIFRCAGAFSLVSHEHMEKMGKLAIASDAQRIVMDLREVAHMDSAGLGILAMIVKHAISAARLVVVIPSAQVSNLIACTGLDRVILMADSIPAALEATAK